MRDKDLPLPDLPKLRSHSHHQRSMSATLARSVLNVGLIGCGEIAQVAHIPTLGFLNDYFKITYLCDVSEDSLKHCAAKIPVTPKTTRDP